MATKEHIGQCQSLYRCYPPYSERQLILEGVVELLLNESSWQIALPLYLCSLRLLLLV